MPESAAQDAFVRRLTTCQPDIYAYIYAMVPNHQAASDVMQETNLALWRKVNQAEEIRNFDGWVREVARYEVLTYLKKAKREKLRFAPELVDIMAEEAPAASGAIEGQRQALRDCMQKLSPENRDLVQRRYAPGGSVKAIARTLGRSVGAVSQTLYRLRNALQDCVEKRVAGEVR